MAMKFSILFLGALLLVQTTYSAPADSTEKLINEISDIFKQIADRFEIIEVTLDELIELEELVKEKGKTVLKKVLEDPKVSEVKSDAMESIVKEIREYVDQLEKDDINTKSNSNVLEYLDFEDLVNKFKKEKVENLTHEAEIIGNSLKENGLEELEKNVLDHFRKFVEKFIEQIDGYIEKLSDEDKKEEKILLDWYKEFKDEKDLNKKLSIFDDFFIEQNTKSKENKN